MLTTRISPKISVKPLATTKYSAASVEAVERDHGELRGSSTALMNSQIDDDGRDETSAMRSRVHGRRRGSPQLRLGTVLAGPPAVAGSASGGGSPTPTCAVRAMP